MFASTPVSPYSRYLPQHEQHEQYEQYDRQADRRTAASNHGRLATRAMQASADLAIRFPDDAGEEDCRPTDLYGVDWEQIPAPVRQLLCWHERLERKFQHDTRFGGWRHLLSLAGAGLTTFVPAFMIPRLIGVWIKVPWMLSCAGPMLQLAIPLAGRVRTGTVFTDTGAAYQDQLNLLENRALNEPGKEGVSLAGFGSNAAKVLFMSNVWFGLFGVYYLILHTAPTLANSDWLLDYRQPGGQDREMALHAVAGGLAAVSIAFMNQLVPRYFGDGRYVRKPNRKCLKSFIHSRRALQASGLHMSPAEAQRLTREIENSLARLDEDRRKLLTDCARFGNPRHLAKSLCTAAALALMLVAPVATLNATREQNAAHPSTDNQLRQDTLGYAVLTFVLAIQVEAGSALYLLLAAIAGLFIKAWSPAGGGKGAAEEAAGGKVSSRGAGRESLSSERVSSASADSGSFVDSDFPSSSSA